MQHFIQIFIHYLAEIIPALAAGFFISGLVHEFIPEDLVLEHLGSKGLKPIFYSTLIGVILPVCCWGSLPIAVSFYKKGARLGPILAFLVATPATSISALLVAYSVLGLGFAAYIFFAVIFIGMTVGIVGNLIKYTPRKLAKEISCPHCEINPEHKHTHKKSFYKLMTSALHYAYIELPKEIGLELIMGILLAAFVATFVPVGRLIKMYLSGAFGYVFSVMFGIIMYLCSTASVPLIDSLIRQGMLPGAGMTLLIIGPVTSYGTLLVLRKEFGLKVFLIFLGTLIITSLIAGAVFQMIMGFTTLTS